MQQQTPTTLDRYLTEEEERALFSTVQKVNDVYAQRDYWWMQLLRNTGMRVGTLAGLTVLDARTALKHDRLTLRNDICKRKHGYTVPLNKQARSALQKLLSLRKQMDYAEHPDGLLVMSRKHNGMSVRSYQARMQFWRGVADLGVDASPHWFRHTVGQRIMARSTARNPMRNVQSALGHSNINSSAIYTRPTREDMAQTFREIA